MHNDITVHSINVLKRYNYKYALSKPDTNSGPPGWGVLREASHLSKEKIHAKKSRQRIAGLINGCRQRQVKQSKESKIHKK
jgi:hypothetical protein